MKKDSEDKMCKHILFTGLFSALCAITDFYFRQLVQRRHALIQHLKFTTGIGYVLQKGQLLSSCHFLICNKTVNVIQLTDFLIKTVYHNLPNIENTVQLGNSGINR